jgi:hypothetical protein
MIGLVAMTREQISDFCVVSLADVRRVPERDRQSPTLHLTGSGWIRRAADLHGVPKSTE